MKVRGDSEPNAGVGKVSGEGTGDQPGNGLAPHGNGGFDMPLK